MQRHFLFLFFLCLLGPALRGQDRIELGYQTTKRGIVWYRNGLPTHTPTWRLSRDTNAVMWVDTFTAMRYDWDYKNDRWRTKGTFTSTLPPLATLTSGSATIDNRSATWLPANQILHKYDYNQSAWVPVGDWFYRSTAPSNVASGGSNGPAVYTTSLWQDSDDQIVRYWDGDSWEPLVGTSYTDEQAQDAVFNAISGGTGISVSYNDGANTFTITNTGDTDASNELQGLSLVGQSLSITSGNTVTLPVVGINAGTGITVSSLSGVYTINNNGDLSATNEGILGVGSGSGTSSTLLSNTSGANAVTINAAGILSISESTSSNGGSITITGTEVDGSTTNEAWTIDGDDADTEVISNQTVRFQGAGINTTDYNPTTNILLITGTEVDGSTTNEAQTLSATGSGPLSYNINLTTAGGAGGGDVTLSEGAGIDLTRSGNTITIASTSTGTLNNANNGLTLSGTTVQLGGTLIQTTSIDQDGFQFTMKDGRKVFSRYNNNPTGNFAAVEIEGIGATSTTSATPSEDAALIVKAYNNGSSVQYANSLAFGIYTTATDGTWQQSRSQSTTNTYYPHHVNPNGGKFMFGTNAAFDPAFSIVGRNLGTSGLAASTLHVATAGETGTYPRLSFGVNNTMQAVQMYDNVNVCMRFQMYSSSASASVRWGVGAAEWADKMVLIPAGSGQLGVGFSSTTGIHSTLQSSGSFAAGYFETSGSLTLDATHHTVVYTNTVGGTFTLPSPVSCTGREYWINHAGTAGTLSLSTAVVVGNGVTFSSLSPGEWCRIVSNGSAWRGKKW